jgi:ribosome maturation factor RimP
MTSVADRVARTVEPLLGPLGLELFDVEHHGAVLRVVVDRADSGSVDMEGLEQATRLVSRALDADDPLPGRYTLEVSSPGLERNLRTAAHFARAVGSDVALKLAPTDDADAPRRVRGRLVAATPDLLTLLADDGAELTVPLGRVSKAKTIFEWGPAPKPGGPRAARTKGETQAPGFERRAQRAGTAEDVGFLAAEGIVKETP